MKKFVTVVDKDMWQDGFQITFGNGCTISVIFGRSSYSDQGKTTAEVAAWNRDKEWMLYSDWKWVVLKDGYSDVMPRCTADEVAEMMFTLSKE